MIALSNQYTIVLDTCVLAPMPLCDTLLRLAEEPATYVPKWSDDILRELRSTLIKMGYAPAQAERRIEAMSAAFEDAKVTGYENLVPSLTNDIKDRHVLAAAVRCQAHAIVTSNVKHFPLESTAPYDVEVLTPDEFLVRQFCRDQDRVIEKLQDQARARQIRTEELLALLAKRVPELTQRVRDASRSR
ncbi:MAG: PIN domain-containing protein [Bryobacterales bacterium]|nr:PIN domain-containing protein [Bryobacterales bacterium]